MHQRNAPENASMLTSCNQGDAGYISNSDRFHTDTTGEEYELRQKQIERKHQVAATRRAQSMKRDEDRWNEQEARARQEDEYWNKLRENGTKAKKNSSNVAYDIMTIKYNQNVDGERQKYLDDMGKSLLKTFVLFLKFVCSALQSGSAFQCSGREGRH